MARKRGVAAPVVPAKPVSTYRSTYLSAPRLLVGESVNCTLILRPPFLRIFFDYSVLTPLFATIEKQFSRAASVCPPISALLSLLYQTHRRLRKGRCSAVVQSLLLLFFFPPALFLSLVLFPPLSLILRWLQVFLGVPRVCFFVSLCSFLLHYTSRRRIFGGLFSSRHISDGCFAGTFVLPSGLLGLKNKWTAVYFDVVTL